MLSSRPKTWLLSGIPRAGSSMCCRLAAKLPDVVALSEPIGRELSGAAADSDAAGTLVERFVAETRARALSERRVPTVHVDGRLDDNRVQTMPVGGQRRQRRGTRGAIAVEGPLSDDFTLLIKHNALFAALLGALTPNFPCLAVVRNPVAVLASWQTVDLPVGLGRIPAGEQFDEGLRVRLAAETDVLARQIIVLNWFFARFAAHVAGERVIRYERLIESGGGSLFRALGHEDAPTEHLVSRNDNAAYASVDGPGLLSALVNAGGAWRRFYGESDCVAVANAIGGRA